MKLTGCLMGMVSALVLSACATDATTQVVDTKPTARPSKTKVNITQTKEMAYQCMIKGEQKMLRVMYGLDKQNVILAQISLDGELSPVLLLDTEQKPGTVFRNRGLWWVSGSGQVKSNTLVLKTLENTQDGRQLIHDHVIAQNCYFDARESARLVDRARLMEQKKVSGMTVSQKVNAKP